MHLRVGPTSRTTRPLAEAYLPIASAAVAFWAARLWASARRVIGSIRSARSTALPVRRRFVEGFFKWTVTTTSWRGSASPANTASPIARRLPASLIGSSRESAISLAYTAQLGRIDRVIHRAERYRPDEVRRCTYSRKTGHPLEDGRATTKGP